MVSICLQLCIDSPRQPLHPSPPNPRPRPRPVLPEVTDGCHRKKRKKLSCVALIRRRQLCAVVKFTELRNHHSSTAVRTSTEKQTERAISPSPPSPVHRVLHPPSFASSCNIPYKNKLFGRMGSPRIPAALVATKHFKRTLTTGAPAPNPLLK